MIIIFFSWIVIFIVLFSLGDIFVLVYNRFSKSEDVYSIPDTTLLGLCLVCILLPFSSFWLPSNHYILFCYILMSIIYWGCRRKRFSKLLISIRYELKKINIFQKSLIITFILGFLAFVSYLSINPDSILYHYQNIYINEMYKVIPGIANIEDRFGFNSNYLLVSSIFTFRFLSGESLYPFQSLLFVCIGVWLFVNVFVQHKLIYILGIICFLFILLTNLGISNTSTDIVPTLIIFYYVLSLTTNKKNQDNLLFIFIIPVVLITFKLSMAPLSFVCLVVLIRLLKVRQMCRIGTVLLFSFLILSLWCARNIIISGYVVYPLDYLAIFSFDWCVPKETAMLQKVFIHDWAKLVLYNDFINFHLIFEKELPQYKVTLLQMFIPILSYVLCIASILIVIYTRMKHHTINSFFYVLFIALLLGLIVSLMSAPDSRFYIGFIIGMILEGGFLLLLILRKDDVKLDNMAINSTVTVAVIFSLLVMYKYQKNMERMVHKVHYDISKAIFYPIDPLKINNTQLPLDKRRLNDKISIYLVDEFSAPLKYTPFTNSVGIPYTPFYGKKVQSIETIEARGEVMEDGFRTKKKFIGLFHLNAKKYIEEYRIAMKEKVKQEGFMKIRD